MTNTALAAEMKILQGYQLAAALHGRQKDKLGRPYIEHLSRVFLRVLERGGDRDQQIAALLHDSIEDGKATRESLLEAGVPPEAVALIEVLSKPELMPYQDYVRSVLRVPRAVLVKRADLDDNRDPQRLELLPPEDAQRLRTKYEAAVAILDQGLPQDSSAADGVATAKPTASPKP